MVHTITLAGTQNMLTCAAVYRIVLDTSLASYDGEGGGAETLEQSESCATL